VRALRELTTETEMYVVAAGREAAVHRTDLAALGLIMDREDTGGDPATPGWLSQSMQLSAPATSALLDRLEQHGHVERHPHPHDRRSVQVTVTDHARQVGATMFGRVARELTRVMGHYSDEDLDLIAQFLEEASIATRTARTEAIT
jgi:DNA-binding MarR family transcriptional regulator